METKLDASVNQRFSSRWGLLLSVLGIAVGTGNIWRFPRIVAQNGGDEGAGAFLIAWIVFLFLWSIPLIIAEYALGRKYRRGVVGTIADAAGRKFTWMGAFVAFVSTAITFFYSIIVGWCLFYFFKMLTSPLPMTTDSAVKMWNMFQHGGWPFFFHALIMGLGALAIWRGIRSIERINKVLIPALFLIVVLSVIRALTLPGAWSGIAYVFKPQWSQLGQPKIWLEALTQNAWDTGAGWGLFLTYAAYMKREHNIVKNAFSTGVGNNVVSLLAALMVFGTVFAVLQAEMGMTRPEVLEIMRTSGPASTGLTFIWMPQLFARMFFGHPLSLLFFLGLTFAGFSSLIAQLELPTRVFIDAGLKRPVAIGVVVGGSYLLGIPSAMSLNILNNQDFVWGIALMISGAFVAFAAIRSGITRFRAGELLTDGKHWKLNRAWEWVLRYCIPSAAVILLIWWLSLSATVYARNDWFNPIHPLSIMTCIVQWFIVLGMLFLLNRWMADRTFGTTIVEHKV